MYISNGWLWRTLIDKWRLGALRLLGFSSFAILFAVSRSWLARWLTISPPVSLGKISLEVFCAHLLFCFAALSFAGDGTGLRAWMQSAGGHNPRDHVFRLPTRQWRIDRTRTNDV
jgi:hypothetical protein